MNRPRLLFFAAASLLLLGAKELPAEASNLRTAYERLRDAMYNDEPLEAVEPKYQRALEELASAFVGSRERSLWASRLEYLMGRACKVQEQKQAAAEHYERGLAEAEASMASAVFSEGWRMMSENISHLCLVRDLGFILANGLKVREYAEKALELDPNNVAAQIIIAAGRIYPPAMFGGNPRVGIELMTRALETGAGEKDDLFNIYSGIGLAHGKLRNSREARAWLQKALALYPNNRYVNEELRKLRD